MDKSTISKFKTMFEAEKSKLLYSGRVINEDFQFNTDDLSDELDLTSTEIETSMRIRLRNREALFLKKIDEALVRISEGSFGECNSCGNDIEHKRLEVRPTTDLCLSCKEDQERKELLHIDGHRSKSLGKKMRFA